MNLSSVPWEAVAESPAMFATRTVHLLVDSASIVLNFCTATAWIRSTERHLNQRILFLNICVAAFLTNFTHLAKASYFFLNFQKPQGLVLSTRTCQWTEFLRSIVSRTTVFFVIGAAAERIIALHFHSSYERRSCVFSVVWSTLSWGQSIAIFVYFLSFTRDDLYLPYCTSMLTTNRTVVLVLIAVYAAIGLLALLMFAYCWAKAKKLLKAYSAGNAYLSLSSRLQLRQNLDSTLTLLPTILWHVVLFASVQSYMAFVLFNTLPSFADTIIYITQVDLMIAVYFMVDAAILLYVCRPLRLRLVVLLPRFIAGRWRELIDLQKVNVLLHQERTLDDDSKYFEALQHSWLVVAKSSTSSALSRKFMHRSMTSAVQDSNVCSEQHRTGHSITCRAAATYEEDLIFTAREAPKESAKTRIITPAAVSRSESQPSISSGRSSAPLLNCAAATAVTTSQLCSAQSQRQRKGMSRLTALEQQNTIELHAVTGAAADSCLQKYTEGNYRKK